MTTLLIARHGNTFDKGDTLLRVGARTDLPLSSSGRQQAILLGKYLASTHPAIDAVYTSTLQRTQQTAQLALQEAGIVLLSTPLAQFNEIDYGPDEGKPEDQVIARIGADALKAWEDQAIPPQGWQVNVPALIENWKDFAAKLVPGSTTLVVTSNGIARFAPYLLENPEEFIKSHAIKLRTGAISCLIKNGQHWQVEYWDRKPA